MTNTHDYTWDDEFEPIGTIPVVGDVLRWVYNDELRVPDFAVCSIDENGCCYDSEGCFRSHAGGVAEGTCLRILKRRKNPEKPAENKENPQKTDENIQILDENDLFSLAADRIEIRSDGYGPENAFQDIADRLSLWLKQRFSVEISLTASDAADILQEFKQARRLVRLRAGKSKRDDTVDQTGYIWWRDKLGEGK